MKIYHILIGVVSLFFLCLLFLKFQFNADKRSTYKPTDIEIMSINSIDKKYSTAHIADKTDIDSNCSTVSPFSSLLSTCKSYEEITLDIDRAAWDLTPIDPREEAEIAKLEEMDQVISGDDDNIK